MHIVHMRMVGPGGKDIHTRVVYTVYTVCSLFRRIFYTKILPIHVYEYASYEYLLNSFFFF